MLRPYVYVIGGQNGISYTGSEYYDPTEDKWSSFTPLNHARHHHNIVSFDEHIFVTGGFDSNVSSSMEIYNPHTDCWSNGVDMITGRFDHGMAVLNDNIYVAGGVHDTFRLSNVEKLDPFTCRWSSIEAMEYLSGFVRLVQLEGCLFGIGVNGDKMNSFVERYDPRVS